jgi:hypothetical protein
MTHLDYADNRGPGRQPKYPLTRMAVGETAFFPGADANDISKRTYQWKPMRWRARTVVSGGVKGARVWRIA